MDNRLAIFLGLMIAIGLFVYLVASFLVATFNITLWYDYYRFFAVVAYFVLLGAFFNALSSSLNTENSISKREKEEMMES